MSKRPARLLIEDILEAMEKIERYTRGMTQKAFMDDEKTADAVVRNLEIIGEAANRLPEDFKGKYRDIEWGKMVGLRHRIVHGYFGVDLEIIWRILQQDLPTLKSTLLHVRNELNP